MRQRSTANTILPPLEVMRRVDALLDHFESRPLATKLGISETSVLKIALGRPIFPDTLRQAHRRLGDVEAEADKAWQEQMIARTGARPVLLARPEEPLG